MFIISINLEFYNHFLKSSVSKNSSVLQALSISEQVKKLGEGIDLLSRELQKQVQEKHDDLLRQGNHATKLESVLSAMNGHVQNLFANAERLRNQVFTYFHFYVSIQFLYRLQALTMHWKHILKFWDVCI